MKNKRFTAKILIDIGMTIGLLLLMPYSLLSETAHEWIGMAMLVLFISQCLLFLIKALGKCLDLVMFFTPQ